MDTKKIDLSAEQEKHLSEVAGRKIKKVDLVELTTEEISKIFPDLGDSPILLVGPGSEHADW
jgi:hypothetical protein